MRKIKRILRRLLAKRQADRVLFLIAPQRTGTTVLRELLAKSEFFDPYGEVFHPEKGDFYSFFAFLKGDPEAMTFFLEPTKENRIALFDRFLDHCMKRSAKRFLLIDAKQNNLHHFNTYWQGPSQPPFFLEILRRYRFPIVHITRRNLFNQALSTFVARQTGQWHLHKGETLDRETACLTVPIDQIEKMLRRFKADNELIKSALQEHERVLHLEYEDMYIDNEFLAPEIPKRLAALLHERQLKGIARELPLIKSVGSPADLVKNRDKLIAHFSNTEFAWMVSEALE